MLKAHSRAIEIEGNIWTEDGQEIYIVHGQYWEPVWRGWQTDNQTRMIDREFEGSPSYKSRSTMSFALLCEHFERHKRAIGWGFDE